MVAGREGGSRDGGSAALPSGAGGTRYHLRKQPGTGSSHAKNPLASISRVQGGFATGEMPVKGGWRMLFLSFFFLGNQPLEHAWAGGWVVPLKLGRGSATCTRLVCFSSTIWAAMPGKGISSARAKPQRLYSPPGSLAW